LQAPIGAATRSNRKPILLGVLERVGVFRLFAFFNRHKLRILFYHGVTAQERFTGIDNYRGKHIRLSRFRAHLDLLSRRYRVIPLPDAIQALRKGSTLPPRSVVITFDDGYENNALVALPALRDAGLPAAFFLTAEYIGTDRCFWVDEVEQVCASPDRDALFVRLKGAVERLPLGSEDERRATHRRILLEAKRLPEGERRRWLDALFTDNAVGRTKATGDFRLLSWEQVRALHAAGMTIGSHTLTHPIVTRLPEEQRRREILGGREACERALGVPCDTFAYPNGQPGDFNEASGALLRRFGFSCGLTTVHGLNARGTDLYTLRRIGVGDATSDVELDAHLSGFTSFALSLLQHVRRRRRSARQ
jgi:peptidoglycan/xylan/chitin deacetylase (PgdA/CDA1 family)